MAVAVFFFCLCGLTIGSRTNMEVSSGIPDMWSIKEKVSDEKHLLLIFAVKQTGLEDLERTFYSVSDPDSPQYGKFLSLEEVNHIVKPDHRSLAIVLKWIHQHNVHGVVVRHDHVEVLLSSGVATSMVNCDFHTFEHTKNGKKIVRCPNAYSLPTEIADHVDVVFGVKHFPKMERATVLPSASPNADLGVTPSVLKQRYNIGNVVGVAKNNSQSVVQFLQEYYENADLQEFFYLFLSSAVGNTATLVGPDGLEAGTEASLDIEYIMSTGQNIPTVFWSHDDTKDPPNSDSFMLWLLKVGSTKNVPLVFSVSYGEDEVSLSREYAQRINTEFQKTGVRGISILFASGDSGVGGSSFGCKVFAPDFPAASPYVTAVGGTTLDGWFESGKEIVNGLSGGGFSNYFPTPSYQSSNVKNYIASMQGKLPAAGKWNSTGRGYPDISALSSNFVVVQDRVPVPGVAGTSCAAPTASGIIALLNDLRLQNGKPQLGFLNILLYKLAAEQPQVFTDIVKGSNPGCGTNGFSATKGWDPSSGLGSLNYGEFAKIILKY